MNVKDIKDLIKFITESGLSEVNLETQEIKLFIKRSSDAKGNDTYVSNVQRVHQPLALPVDILENTSTPPQPVSFKEANYVKVKSPMIGTFYSSPNPDSPPFVKIGDRIEKGQKLCVIEAMKLFNEIESEVSGTIVKMLADNASPVEYDQELFLVDPSSTN